MLYRVYGLLLAADLYIDGLYPADGFVAPDVSLHVGDTPVSLNGDANARRMYVTDEAEGCPPNLVVDVLNDGEFTRFVYADGVTFHVNRSASDVWVTWPHELEFEDALIYLLGPICGFILRKRGILPIHASSLVIDGCAFGLVGEPGAGKSTTAAGLIAHGCSILSDDVLALHDRRSTFLAMPGYPRIRLWSQSSEALFGAPDALPLLAPNWDKRYLDLNQFTGAFETEPQTLSALYLLGERSDDFRAPFIEELAPQDALMSLVANTYVNYLLDAEMRAREFEILGRIIKNLPVKRVTPHSDISHLPELCDVILEDFDWLLSPINCAA